MSNRRHPETLVASAGVGQDSAFNAVTPPIHVSTTYVWPDPATKPDCDYGRGANPTRLTLQAALAELEGAAGGVVTSTGMAAIDLASCLVPAGARVMAPHDCYGGTHRLFTARHRRGDLVVDFVDQTDEAAFAEALARRPALVWLETPSNPLMRIVDIRARAQAARTAGAITACDNTFLSPARQKPLELGCDLVAHSTTKFINGHTDVLGGALLAKSADHAEELAWWANCIGVTGSAFDSYLTLRGMRTLFARLDRQEASAAAIAQALRGEPGVEAVYYPGLADHPGHAIAARQQSGFGSILSFRLRQGRTASRFLQGLSLISAAASLGGFETLACRPDTMTHGGMEPAARLAAGVDDRLIRLSIGLEH
ncbi:MAG: PLP-dependent transferase, partial [Caulobacterales bacterium]|nr:PLP-dependent transferase [Caulobacterales bacterium]